MDNVLLDRRSSGSFEFPRRGGLFRPGHLGGGATPAMPRQQFKGGAWSHASLPALPYARPPLHSSPSLPLLPSNQPPLLPLPPAATKYATFPYPPPPQQPPRSGRASTPSTRQRDRRRKPSRPPPSTETTKGAQKKKPLERATPLPPAPAVAEALDDLEQEVARNFVQDLLHVLAPPPSSLPLPRFVITSSSPAAGNKVVPPPPPAPSCNAEAAAADSLRRVLRL
uniref:Uncharacterized protein n=1 Tax=Oryza meridionalis TaxID=40149 RepID=A0A0E0CXU1_9ORYZ